MITLDKTFGEIKPDYESVYLYWIAFIDFQNKNYNRKL